MSRASAAEGIAGLDPMEDTPFPGAREASPDPVQGGGFEVVVKPGQYRDGQGTSPSRGAPISGGDVRFLEGTSGSGAVSPCPELRGR